MGVGALVGGAVPEKMLIASTAISPVNELPRRPRNWIVVVPIGTVKAASENGLAWVFVCEPDRYHARAQFGVVPSRPEHVITSRDPMEAPNMWYLNVQVDADVTRKYGVVMVDRAPVPPLDVSR